jgi:hypothetical protein
MGIGVNMPGIVEAIARPAAKDHVGAHAGSFQNRYEVPADAVRSRA